MLTISSLKKKIQKKCEYTSTLKSISKVLLSMIVKLYNLLNIYVEV